MGNRARLCIALTLAIAIGHGTPAGADDWGYSNDDGNGPVQVPDSLDHAYCFDASVPSSRRPVYTGSMAYLDDTTAFSDVAVSCSSITDVAFYEADLGSGIRGYSPCQKWVGWGVCDRTNVYVNAAEIFRNTGACGGGQPRFDVNLITTIRHEIGHTVGLHHIPAVGALCGPPAGDDAMTSDFTPVSLDWVDYNAHHVSHMNCRCDAVAASTAQAPAQAAPIQARECVAGPPASPGAAAAALAATPAWATVDRVASMPFAEVAARADGSLTGRVTGVTIGGRSSSEAAGVPGQPVGEPSARLTVDLLVRVESARGGLAGTVAPGANVAVPLVVWDGSIDGLREEDLAGAHADYARGLDCAVPRSRVTVVGSLEPATAAPDGADAVVALPDTGWLPDPSAMTFGTGGGVESLDWLVPPERAAAHYGATTVDRVADLAARGPS